MRLWNFSAKEFPLGFHIFTIYYWTYWTSKDKHRNKRSCSGENNHIRATMLILVVLSYISLFSIIQSEIDEWKIWKNSFYGTDKMRNLEIHVFIWQIHPDRNSRFFHIYVTRNKITGTYNNNKKFIKETECPNRELNLIFQFKYLNQKHSCYNIHNRYNLRIICNLKYNETISRYKKHKK